MFFETYQSMDWIELSFILIVFGTIFITLCLILGIGIWVYHFFTK